MADFDEKLVEEEVIMLGGMIDELEKSIARLTRVNTSSCPKALAGSIGMDLPSEDKNQLDLTLIVMGRKLRWRKARTKRSGIEAGRLGLLVF